MTQTATRQITHGVVVIDGRTVPAFQVTYAHGLISQIIAVDPVSSTNGDIITDAATLATWSPDA